MVVRTGDHGGSRLEGAAGPTPCPARGQRSARWRHGTDRLDGGTGFARLSYSGFGGGVIVLRNEGDKLDLPAIDANAGAAGNQVFAFRGANNVTAAGRVRYETTLHCTG
jgi:hypothetical protein